MTKTKCFILCLIVITIIAITAISAFIFKSSVTKPENTPNDPDIVSKEMSKESATVSEETQKKLDDLPKETVDDVKEEVSDKKNEKVLKEKNEDSLSKSLAVIGVTKGHIQNNKIEETGESDGVKASIMELMVKGKTHTVEIIFDDEGVVSKIYAENGEELYGYDENNVLHTKDINRYFS